MNDLVMLAMGFILGLIVMCIFIGGKDEWKIYERF